MSDFPAQRRVPQAVLAFFLAAVCVTSLVAMNTPHLKQADTPGVARLMLFRNRLPQKSMIVLLNSQDDSSTAANRLLFDPVNEPSPLRLYFLIEPGMAVVSRWRESFAKETLAAWTAGGEVWLSKRLWRKTPLPEWNWAEGDDPRVTWKGIPPFVEQLETDADVGGEDGFLRLRPSGNNTAALRSILVDERSARDEAR